MKLTEAFIFLVSYVVLCLGVEENEDGRRFVPQYPYAERSAAVSEPADPKLIPVKAAPELVMEVAARSKVLGRLRSKATDDAEEQAKLRSNGQFWDGFKIEKVNPETGERRAEKETPNDSSSSVLAPVQPMAGFIAQPSYGGDYDSSSTPVVPDVPQSIAESKGPVNDIPIPLSGDANMTLNQGEADNDDIEVKMENEDQSGNIATPEIMIEDNTENNPTLKATPKKPMKIEKANKPKDGKIVIGLPGAEVKGSVKAKLIPGTKLYKLLKNAQMKMGANFEPKLLYLLNNY